MAVYTDLSWSSVIIVILQLALYQGMTYAYAVWSCPPWADERMSAPTRHLDHCLLYSGIGFELSWANADTFCSQNGGMLAKDDSDQRYKAISWTLLYGVEIESILCFWIGLTDKGTNGRWRWSDGSPVENAKWTWFEDTFTWLHDRLFDCAGLCSAGLTLNGVTSWLWARDTCPTKNRFICQYDAVLEIQPTSAQPETRVLPITATKVSVTLVLELTALRDFRMSRAADWSIRTYSVTGCARKCKDLKTHCRMFNYNKATRQCNGFNSLSTEDSLPVKGWTMWKLIPKKLY